MKIAFVSYEYPPDTAIGGIATYVRQAAQMLAQRGHEVEVFAASSTRSGCETSPRLKIHRIQVSDRLSFATEIAPIFAASHQMQPFDLVEGPDCGADAAVIAAQFPALPLVLKLHTPSYMLRQVGYTPLSRSAQLRFILGAFRRGQWPKLPQPPAYLRSCDPEYRHALQAQIIAAPCQAIQQLVQTDWEIDPTRFDLVPYPYIPSQNLLDIPIDTASQRVTFIGRLEVRKGILDLMQAIPQVVRQYPDVKFRFVGPAWPSPQRNLDMQAYLRQKLRRYQQHLEFTGAVSLEQIPDYLAQTDICVFPSIWENFPLVCLESMAAGRGVIGSSAGGMTELLEEGKVGRLTPPQQPQQLAQAILQFLQNPDLRQAYGQRARDRVLNYYSLERIGQIQEESYRSAIDRQTIYATVRL